MLVDTSVWSLALRRPAHKLNAAETQVVEAWQDLVRSGQACLMGPIRQELLSGLRRGADFERLGDTLSPFDDTPILASDYVQAARYFNTCRKHGVTGGHIDLLICATAHRAGLPIFTVDPDFAGYAEHVPIKLHQIAA